MLQEVIEKGILQPDDGVYVNQTTGDRLPIPVAMNQVYNATVLPTSVFTFSWPSL